MLFGRMGNGGSSVEELRSKRVSQRLKKEESKNGARLKLLLLGAGDSGKSTIFKQLKFLYGSGFTSEDRALQRQFVVGNVVDGTLAVCGAAPRLGLELSPGAAEAHARLLAHEDMVALDDAAAAAILALWRDASFLAVWARRSEFNSQESWAYFAEQLKAYPVWGGRDFVPSMEDLLRCRVRTTGVVDELFSISDVRLRILDVGGQRNERRKWLHCFEDVTSVVFVVSLGDYNQRLFEDSSQNRLVEALAIWEDVVNNPLLANAAFCLFLNKVDLLEEKYVRDKIPLNASGLFPSAPAGEPDLALALAWFEQLFRARIKDPHRHVYTHVTCATDTKGIDVVLKATSRSILQQNLENAGLAIRR